MLIDYENVQPEHVAELDKEHFRVMVFLGASQSKVSTAFAEALQRMGPRAEYVRIAGSGHNALDFHIAYYIGQLAAKEPDAYFHIVSRDAGFDPLIAHLKSRNVLACRSKDVTDIPLVKVANTKTPSEKIAAIVENLRQRGASKPRTLKTLASTVNALFQKALPDAELMSLLQVMQAQGLLTVVGTKVSYSLPAS